MYNKDIFFNIIYFIYIFIYIQKLSPTSSEKLQKAFAYKEKGTDAFKKSDWKGAIFNYHCVCNFFFKLFSIFIIIIIININIKI